MICNFAKRFLFAVALFALPVSSFAGRDADTDSDPIELTLDRAIHIALTQNPVILKAIEEIRRTRGLVVEVRAQALPQVGLSASYNQTDPRLIEGGINDSGAATEIVVEESTVQGDSGSIGAPGNASASPTNSFSAFPVQNKSWQVAIEARQLIYSGGQVRAALNIARFTQDSSYYSLRDIIEQTINDVKKQYFTVLVNRALISVQEESVELLERELRDQQQRFDAGTVPRFNVLRAEVELANVQPALIRAKNETLVAQLRLARTLGIEYSRTSAGVPPVVATGELKTIPRQIDLAEAIDLAKERRAFLKAQRQQILIELEQIKVALAGYRPRLNLSGGYQLANSQLSDDLGETVNGWFFGVTGSWDIFDGLETSGKVAQAKARLESAKITYEDSVLQVELEVEEAYAKVQEARELLVGRAKNIEQARESLRLASERFQAGAATQLDLLDARVALTRAQVTELQARFDYNVALAEFDRVTGADARFSENFSDPLSRGGQSIQWDKIDNAMGPRVRRATKVDAE